MNKGRQEGKFSHVLAVKSQDASTSNQRAETFVCLHQKGIPERKIGSEVGCTKEEENCKFC